MTDLTFQWLGRVPYAEALERQRAYREARIAGERSDVLWLLEHDPVITVGRRHVPDLRPEALVAPVVSTERGGLATYHGPGQLVGYLLADVVARGLSVRATVEALQDGLIAWLATVGVAAARVDGRPGVWVGGDKIAAVGLHFRRGVSMHGFALNLTTDLRGFSGFVPCGIADAGVTSLERVIRAAPEPASAWSEVGEWVAAAIVARSTRKSAPVLLDNEPPFDYKPE